MQHKFIFFYDNSLQFLLIDYIPLSYRSILFMSFHNLMCLTYRSLLYLYSDKDRVSASQAVLSSVFSSTLTYLDCIFRILFKIPLVFSAVKDSNSMREKSGIIMARVHFTIEKLQMQLWVLLRVWDFKLIQLASKHWADDE